jgi:outer membrane protein insertion porin family
MSQQTTRRAISALLLLLLIALPVSVRAVNKELAGLPVGEIEFSGLRGLPAESLEFYLGLEKGRPFDPVALNENIHDLWQRQLIDDIKVDAESIDGQVRLRIAIVERPTLRSVDYVGLKRISRTDIIDRITREGIRVREGDPLSLGELRRLQAVIEELYREKGFRLAEAEFHIEEISAGDRRVTFTIDEGDKVRISELDFEGNTGFGDRRLRWSMKKTKESGLLTRVLKKDVYKPAVFEEDLEKVRELYKKAGYKNVVIGDPKVEVRATKPSAQEVEEQRRRLFVTIPIEEGGRWKLGEVNIEGNERFSEEVLRRQFPAPRGGWLRSSMLEKGMETIGELYSNTGHLFADIQPEIVEKEDLVADINVKIDEGDQFSIGRIQFEGNTKTRDKVIRRELGIQEGMVLNSGALRNSLLRIGQLEFFKVDENDPVAFDFDNEEKTVDLTIKGEEGDRTEMQFGAGFSEIDGFFGQFSFRTRNFLGRGETLGVQLQSGRRQDVFDLSYLVPWFLDRPQSLGMQVFSRKLDYDLLSGQSIRQDTQGGTITYGRNLGLFKSLSLSYSIFEAEDQRSIFSPILGDFVEQDLTREVSTVRLAYAFDRRDSRLEPTRGIRYSAGIEYAGGVLGGDTNFIRPRASFSIYKPVTRGGMLTVAALNVEAGHIVPFDNQELFFLDRFYLGGENSVRGFQFRSIWARDDEGNTIADEFGVPLGGESFLQLNLEYHFVVGGPFRVLLFADSGNVWAEEQSIDLGGLRYSLGVELRVNVPLFGAPLRFIYSTNPDSYLDDRFESFQFSVGTTF